MLFSTTRCDCCSLPVGGTGDFCPRCGYPVNGAQEEQFLQSSLLALKRVAAYGGANMTVAQLIERYRVRLHYLTQVKALPAGQTAQDAREAPVTSVAPMPLHAPAAQSSTAPSPSAEGLPQPQIVPAQGAPSQETSARSFSLGSFLEEQTITVVAALGAFLILVGALSFVATTPNLLLSFLVVFGVHALFGTIGIISYRYRSFRAVAVIYTAIFALLVPLVGFSAYRVVSGSMVQFSTSTLVAIAALYAALVYGMLAVYQKFSPFAYLAVVALALPLDVLALIEIALALLLGFNQRLELVLAMWLCVAVLFYGVALYQRRAHVLVLPVVFASLIIPVLFMYPRVLFGASILLPLAAAGIYRLLTKRWHVSSASAGVVWEWPLLAIGIFYGAMLGLHDTFSALSHAGSTLENWLHIPFLVGLELATIALFWYGAAALVRNRWWLLIVTGFAVAAVLVPGSSFQVLLWLAPLLALLGLGVSRLAGKVWAFPLYTVAGFAMWSVIYAELTGDLYRLSIVVLACAALGIGIGCLRFLVPKLASATNTLLRYALPLYAVAGVAAALTGIYGVLVGVNAPFFVAIPTALLLYALVDTISYCV